MAAAALAACTTLPALAGPVNWAHQAGTVQSNGAVVIKSLSGGSYAATTNPTGSMVRMNQNSATQPPTVLVNGGMPCFVGMKKKNRETYCTLGGDVVAAADDPTVVGKYAGKINVKYRIGTGSSQNYGTFEHDFIVALTDIANIRFACYTGSEQLTPQWSLLSVNSIMGYKRPPEIPGGGVWVQAWDYGLEMSSQFMYDIRQGNCSAALPETKASANVLCANMGKGWYIPSLTELTALYERRDAIKDFENVIYWSSQSTPSNTYAYALNFANKTSEMRGRHELLRLRCTRVFDDLFEDW